MAIEPKRAVKQINGYQPVRQDRLNFIRLDMGENTAGFSDLYGFGLQAEKISTYPFYGQLIKGLSELYSVPEEFLLLTNGSDDALHMVPYVFIEPGQDRAVVSDPCFPVIATGLFIAGAQLIKIPILPTFEFDLVTLAAGLETNPKMCVLANPDNPTGSLIAREVIEEWTNKYRQTLFVIDEAYADYTKVSVMDLCARRDNLLVTRTFSKAWGMAGLRLGVIIGHPVLLQWLNKIRLPFNVNSAAVAVGQNLVKHHNRMANTVKETMLQKQSMIEALQEIGFTIKEGTANFFLLNAQGAAWTLTQFLEEKGILVRPCAASEDRAHPLWGWIKISIGTKKENQTFLGAIKEFVESVMAASRRS